jgi:putative PIN family toxin of toxin-antitoxin system
VAREIVDVLRRPAISRYGVTEADIEELLVVLGPLLPDVEVEIELRDPNDAPVIASAVAARAEAIVTGDRDVLDDAALRAWLSDRSIAVMTPAETLERLRP